MSNTSVIDPSSIRLYQPPPDSRKGDNGRLLVIGGSKLFHSSIFWSADVASRIVDLVHFTSPANENNELVRKKLKDGFWNGIVVEWGDVEHYVKEDDCVLIGPGMIRHGAAERTKVLDSEVFDREAQTESARTRRDEGQRTKEEKTSENFATWRRSDMTREIVNYFLKKYPSKRWVVDGGALQEVDPKLINSNMIITPNLKEFYILCKKIDLKIASKTDVSSPELVTKLSEGLGGCTVVLKGPTDIICQGENCVLNKTGNEGMTKGGTGDVLAGLVAALYCKNDPSLSLRASAWTAATAGAYVNGLAGDELKKRIGVYFNAGDLVNEVSKALAQFL